jgi:hypothetical protein
VTNISHWLIDNPFKIVLFFSLLGVFFITKEGSRVVKHRRRRKLIEERKKLKNGIR